MDQKKLVSMQIKLKILSQNERASCLYQWVLTKHIRLDEFTALFEWCQQNQPLTQDDDLLVPSHSTDSGLVTHQAGDRVLVK